MSRVMQEFRKYLSKYNIKYYERIPNSNVVCDIRCMNNKKNLDPAWDVCGYEGTNKVHIYLRSYIPPELAAQIINLYENYFLKED